MIDTKGAVAGPATAEDRRGRTIADALDADLAARFVSISSVTM
jgi:hypothetical protein